MRIGKFFYADDLELDTLNYKACAQKFSRNMITVSFAQKSQENTIVAALR